MSNKIQLFNKDWLSYVKLINLSDSWADAVLQDITGYGCKYLSNINNLFQYYPDQSIKFKTEIESIDNVQHLGRVNELFWYNLAQKVGFEIEFIPSEDYLNKPDFYVNKPTAFYCEVTTINFSKDAVDNFICGTGSPLKF